MRRKFLGLSLVFVMIGGFAFLPSADSNGNPFTASAQVRVKKKRKPGIIRSTYRGGRWVTIRVYEGGKWVTKRVWRGSKWVGKKSYKTGRKVVSRSKKIIY